MTKFEEEAMKELAKSEYVYTAYDGTFRGETDGTVMEFAEGTTIYTFPWLEFAKNWHSDEEYQELLKENNKLKSQLQQQALPVVPEFVAEWYEEKKNKLELAVYKINTLIDKKSFNDLTKIEKWFEGVENKPIETIFKMKDGYTVEKPQLFYLREKNTGYYLNKSKNNGLELVPNPYFDEDNQFTKQEIDSMQTGSYEQIEVAE